MPSAPIDMREEDLPESQMTLRQVAFSVKRGQRVTAFIRHGGEEQVIGYLAGVDPAHWFILQPGDTEFRQLLVSRRDTPVLEIHTERTYDQEPLHRSMERIIRPFRTWIDQNVFPARS